MKIQFFITFTIIFISTLTYSQLDSVYYLGPSIGSVSGGAIQTTENFTSDFTSTSGDQTHLAIPLYKSGDSGGNMINGWDKSQLPDYKYMEDVHNKNYSRDSAQTVLLNNFTGIPMTNYIPPDPVIAAGPEHLIICANSIFRIMDKEGNVLKIIPASNWWAPVWPDENGDPQIVYDFYEQRWLMVWMQVNSSVQTAGNLIAYSDDSNPLGNWYMYRLDTKKHGTINSNSWGDYPHVGFDDEAIYITTRCIDFGGGGFLYNKIRIINKSELYNSNGGPLSYSDIWNIRKPASGISGSVLDFIHPVICYTPGNGGWFFWASGIYGGSPVSADFYAIYKINNPLTSLSLKGKVLPVQTYTSPPLANQLGGGLGIETIGWITRQPIVRDGFLFTSHDIQNTFYSNYSSIKYLKIDLNTVSIIENLEYGSEGYFYLFPALTVDKDHNVAITFSRSADIEYIGAYYTTKHAASMSEFIPSLPFAEGNGNYVVTYGGNINRWGDYFGIYLDPANDYDVWMISEYSSSTNNWATQVARIRMVPFPGIYSFYSPSSLAFGDVEINTTSEEKSITISNYGVDDLIISSIASAIGPFTRTSNHSFPVTLQSFDSLDVKINFSPSAARDYEEILTVNSNDPIFTGLKVVGHAYDMLEAFTDIFYASTGIGNNGDMLTINRVSGTGTTLGSSLFPEVKSVSVNPNNNLIYGLVVDLSGVEIVRINARQGDAYKLFDLNLSDLSAIAFDNSGILYTAKQNGEIYSIDITSGNSTLITTASIFINALAFHPQTNDLWAARRKVIGSGKDEVYKIDLTTGTATLIGSTGFGVLTNGITFDEDNKLYGVIGASDENSRLIEINTTNGNGQIIGDIGFMHVLGITFAINGPVNSVESNNLMPGEFKLNQNYPNPFNPSTRIEYKIAELGWVTLKVYDVLGNEVMTLVNEQKPAGTYEVEFDASSLTSGVYFYQLTSGELIITKKMVLLR